MGAEETFFRKIGNFFHFFHKVENSENLFIRAYKCAKFQQKIFSEKKWHPSSGILSKNFQISNRIYSENLPLFQLFRKFRNFIPLSRQVCQVSAKSKKLFFFIIHSFIIHHDHSLRSWLCRLGVYR